MADPFGSRDWSGVRVATWPVSLLLRRIVAWDPVKKDELILPADMPIPACANLASFELQNGERVIYEAG